MIINWSVTVSTTV